MIHVNYDIKTLKYVLVLTIRINETKKLDYLIFDRALFFKTQIHALYNFKHIYQIVWLYTPTKQNVKSIRHFL